jgi:hypothetical protein
MDRETGLSHRVPGAGGRRAAPGRPGNWPIRGGEARQGPLHLIHGGGLVAFCPTEGFLPGRHAGKPGRAERLWSASRDDHEPPCSTGPVISGREAPPTVRPSCSRTLPPDRFPSVPTSPHPARSPHPHPARRWNIGPDGTQATYLALRRGCQAPGAARLGGVEGGLGAAKAPACAAFSSSAPLIVALNSCSVHGCDILLDRMGRVSHP